MSRAEPPSQLTNWDWAQSALLACNLVWTTLSLGGYRPETMTVTVALTGLMLAVHALAVGIEGRRIHPAAVSWIPFLGYALWNVLWVTPVRWLGWFDWLAWVNMAAVFWVALHLLRDRRPRRAVFFVLIGLALVGVLLACYQRFVDPKWLMLGRVQIAEYHGRASGPFGIPNSLAAFLLLLLPATGWLAGRSGATSVERVGWGWVTAVLLLGFVLTISRGGWIAMGVALTAWPLFGRRGRWTRKLIYSAGALAATALLAGIVIATVPKARERFVRLANQSGERSRPIMWRAAWDLFESSRLWGTGGGSYNVVFERSRPEQFLDDPQWAHNEYLNTLSDYGLVGFGLAVGGIGWVGIGCVRRRPKTEMKWKADWTEDPGLTTALTIGLVAFAVQISFDFHLKIPALAMTAATIVAWIVRSCWPDLREVKAGESRRTGLVVVVAGTAVVAGGWFVIPLGWGEALRYRARQEIDQLALVAVTDPVRKARIEYAHAELERAVRLSPRNGQAWADLAYAASLQPLVESARREHWGRIAESAADRALALSAVHAEFWVRRGGARDLQGRWLGAGDDFGRAIELAPRNAWIWYYQAEHLSRRSNAHGLRDSALAFCLRLDPGNSAGLALRQRLAISQNVP